MFNLPKGAKIRSARGPVGESRGRAGPWREPDSSPGFLYGSKRIARITAPKVVGSTSIESTSRRNVSTSDLPQVRQTQLRGLRRPCRASARRCSTGRALPVRRSASGRRPRALLVVEAAVRRMRVGEALDRGGFCFQGRWCWCDQGIRLAARGGNLACASGGMLAPTTAAPKVQAHVAASSTGYPAARK